MRYSLTIEKDTGHRTNVICVFVCVCVLCCVCGGGGRVGMRGIRVTCRMYMCLVSYVLCVWLYECFMLARHHPRIAYCILSCTSRYYMCLLERDCKQYLMVESKKLNKDNSKKKKNLNIGCSRTVAPWPSRAVTPGLFEILFFCNCV